MNCNELDRVKNSVEVNWITKLRIELLKGQLPHDSISFSTNAPEAQLFKGVTGFEAISEDCLRRRPGPCLSFCMFWAVCMGFYVFASEIYQITARQNELYSARFCRTVGFPGFTLSRVSLHDLNESLGQTIQIWHELDTAWLWVPVELNWVKLLKIVLELNCLRNSTTLGRASFRLGCVSVYLASSVCALIIMLLWI